jgi:hypothetical protein
MSGDQATDPVNGIAAGSITIALPKTTYSTSDLSPSSGQGVRATLGNSADQPFYSRIGDAFNASAEQNPLFVANGSDASLEREQGSSWVAVTGVALIEGVKIVALQPGQSYELIAHASAPVSPGRYRFVLAYRDAPSAESTRRVTSAIFTVQ